jgi:hypothetical protein
MADSFVIQNHSASNFENYYKSMKKRHQSQSKGKEDVLSIGKKSELLYGKLHGRRPAARDGHTGLVVDDMLIVFGGDRHHMPFNDTFKLDLKAEIMAKGLI